jgi:hypothetical protein
MNATGNAALPNGLTRLQERLAVTTELDVRKEILLEMTQLLQTDDVGIDSIVQNSGLTAGHHGHQILVTQGQSGCSLVAAKKCLFRLFVDGRDILNISNFKVRVRSGASDNTYDGLNWFSETAAPNGPSVCCVIDGPVFPTAGFYTVALIPEDLAGRQILVDSLTLFFLPTKDLRLLVIFITRPGVFLPTPEWYSDIASSMLRLGQVLPVRDGVQPALNGSRCAGLRYLIGSACDGFGPDAECRALQTELEVAENQLQHVVDDDARQDIIRRIQQIQRGLRSHSCGPAELFQDCAYSQTRKINQSAGDHIDITCDYRPGFYFPQFNPPGDPFPGGNSGRPPAPYSDLPRAAFVGGLFQGVQMTAPTAAQEIGHNFGLEPPTSPHFEDPRDARHSRDPLINDPLAFDFVKNAVYPRLIGDVMSNEFPNGRFRGSEATMYNAYDWEYVRGGIDGAGGLMALASTGTESLACYPPPNR